MTFTRIDRVGLELEGGWNARPENAAHHADGSVRNISAPIVGEYVSAPMATPEDVAAWLTATYPDTSNETCGMHAHVSFKNRRDYARLMDPKFFEYFTARMTAWGRRANIPSSHRFWNRLDGFNSFCQKDFRPNRQAAATSKRRSGGVRYTQLNFCFRLHGTIECRLFPVFRDKAIAVSAVKELCAIYEDYLRETEYVEHVETIETL